MSWVFLTKHILYKLQYNRSKYYQAATPAVIKLVKPGEVNALLTAVFTLLNTCPSDVLKHLWSIQQDNH